MNRNSTYPPPLSINFWSLLGTAATALAKIDWGTLAMTSLIERLSSFKFPGIVLNTLFLTHPHRQKSYGVRSGLLAGQWIGPPRPIHLFWKWMSSHCLTLLAKWGGAPSCMNFNPCSFRIRCHMSSSSILRYLSAFMVSFKRKGPINRSAVMPHQMVTLSLPTVFSP